MRQSIPRQVDKKSRVLEEEEEEEEKEEEEEEKEDKGVWRVPPS